MNPTREQRLLHRGMQELAAHLDTTTDPDLVWDPDRPLLFALCSSHTGPLLRTELVLTPIGDRTWRTFPAPAVIAEWGALARAGKAPMPQAGLNAELAAGAEVTGWLVAYQTRAIPVAADATIQVIAALVEGLDDDDWRPTRVIAGIAAGQRHVIQMAWLQHPDPDLPPVELTCECSTVDPHFADALHQLPYGTPGNLT